MNDREKIRNLVRKYQHVIHTQNKEDFMSLWTCDNSNTFISITNKYVGIDSIYHDFLIDGIQKSYKNINLIAEEVDIKFISNYIAIVIFKYHTDCIKRKINEEYGISGLETQVVKKIDDQWKLVHVHYSK